MKVYNDQGLILEPDKGKGGYRSEGDIPVTDVFNTEVRFVGTLEVSYFLFYYNSRFRCPGEL